MSATASITVQFTGEEPGGRRRAAQLHQPVGSFDNGIDVAINDLLDEAGVDTQKLASKRFSCQSMDSIDVCKSQVFNDVGFGEIADFVWGDDKLDTTAKGTLDYSWADDDGNVYPGERAVPGRHLAGGDRGAERAAECGDGFGGSPEALRYQDVQLADRPEATMSSTCRCAATRTSSSYTARLKMQSDRHVVVPPVPAVAQVRRRQRQAEQAGQPSTSSGRDYRTSRQRQPPAACYLPEGSDGC